MPITACATLPTFFRQPPADTQVYLYTVGVGDNKNAATEDALSRLSLRLSSDIEASVHSMINTQRDEYKSETQSALYQQTHQLARPFTFNNYQIARYEQIKGQHYVLIHVHKPSFLADIEQTALNLLNPLLIAQQKYQQQDNQAELALSQFALRKYQNQLFKDAALLDAFNYPHQIKQRYSQALNTAISAANQFNYQLILPEELSFLKSALYPFHSPIGFSSNDKLLTVFITGAIIESAEQSQAARKLSLQYHWLTPQGKMMLLGHPIEVHAVGSQQDKLNSLLVEELKNKV
ncbi:LPP20 family lipoprotein [Catenovulum sediminis]|uniref:LPP20 family lipoprotein n=1 Tax=Catenovulum sediminis TaxID=1740262 RepID=A0ABV1RMS5_9ALTE